MATPQVQRSIPIVLHDIVANLQDIIRSEFRLAKTELKEAAGRAARPTAAFAAGLVLGAYAIGLFLLASVYGLSLVMRPWLAALLVGAVVAGIASALLTSAGNELKRFNPTPEKTIQSVQENLQWAKHLIR
jgi:Putative Actinobacterial Holin-X, holin superfamily III